LKKEEIGATEDSLLEEDPQIGKDMDIGDVKMEGKAFS
jgi:hypothetical protein